MKKYFTSRLIVFVLSLVSMSCRHKYIVMDASDLKSAFILNSSPSFKGYYYMGSDTTYHYFQSRWDVTKDRYFKIFITDLNVIQPFPYQEKTAGQRIDLLRLSNEEEFGKNKFYTLYNIRSH